MEPRMIRGVLAQPLKCYLLSGQKKVQITLNLDFKNVFLNIHFYCIVFLLLLFGRYCGVTSKVSEQSKNHLSQNYLENPHGRCDQAGN